ncbi:MAG: secretin N-terminal domain-containing protein [Opitutaceae bacterium]|nr:secretin N-terminal domain-containing protein [Opitutaceae bacterium]
MISRAFWLLCAAALTSWLSAQTVVEAPPAMPQQATAHGAAVLGLVTRPDELFAELNLPSTPLNMLVLPIEELTNRTVLRQQGLPNPEITLVFKTPPTRAEAMQALESVLNLNQIALIPLGTKFIKMVPMQNVRVEGPELIETSTLSLPPSGRIASKLYTLDFLRVTEFVPQIAPLLNPSIGNYALFEKTNSVLITDSVANLQRIEALVSRIDKPALSALQTRFYTLQFAKASELVNKLRNILQGPLQNQLSTATTYSADDRTNQIILISDSRQFALFDELVQKLDVRADPNTRNEVVYLKHAASKDVATLLTNIVSGQNKAAAQAEGGASGRPLVANQPPPAPVAVAAPESGGSDEFSQLITIQADERSNALILSGTVDDIRLLRELINKIDVVLPQVLIEVVIAEVTLTDSQSSGLSALGLNIRTVNGATQVAGFNGTVAGWNVQNGIVDPTQFDATLQTLGSRSNVKVLSRPNIMTMHNKEGKVSVGNKLPIITGTTSTPISGGTTGGFATQQQVNYQDIAITLTVTPLIGDDGTIQLKINQKVQDTIRNVTINGNQQPVIGNREAESFLNVKDGEMIVLGGLQRVKNDRSRDKVGILYEIPVISHILGGRNRNDERTELLLFIRPKVVAIENGSANTLQRIDELSGKENIKQFLEDPSKPLKETLGEKVR